MRMAFFWTPLERVSHGLRGFADPTISRQAGAAAGTEHRKVAWVCQFVHWDNYTNDQVPDLDDSAALVQHFRLRGCDGFNNCGGDVNFLTTAVNGWRALDAHFGTSGGAAPTKVPTFINLGTVKTAWTQWSAARVGNSIKVLVSNLHPIAAQSVIFPDVLNGEGGFPYSVLAPANSHSFYTYTIANAMENGRFTSNANGWGLVNGTTFESTGSPSAGSPGHVRLNGAAGQIYALTSPNILMTPTTRVRLNLNARFEGGARLRSNYYFRDKTGAVMMNGGSSMWGSTGLNVSETDSLWHNYTQDFTVANNEKIGYISFIFYVYHGDGTTPQAGDAIRLDDIVVTFP